MRRGGWLAYKDLAKLGSLGLGAGQEGHGDLKPAVDGVHRGDVCDSTISSLALVLHCIVTGHCFQVCSN